MNTEHKVYVMKKCPLSVVIASVAEIAQVKVKVIDRNEFTEERQSSLIFGDKTPVISTPFGDIFGIHSILRYLARCAPASFLYGETLYESALVDALLEGFHSNILKPIKALCSTACPSECKSDKSEVDLGTVLSNLDDYLLSRTFLAGHRVTIADILIAVVICFTVDISKGSLSINGLVNLSRFVNTIMNNYIIRKHYDNLKKYQTCTDSNTNTKSKKGNPSDSLPKSSMNLDEWKRIYSNTKDLNGVAMPWLVNNFDPEGFSFYYMKYNKLPDELDVPFRASNMLGGFLQRLDNSFRKHSFGVINVVGDDDDFDYQGIFLFRGQDVPEEMRSHPSFDYHSFSKLDFQDPEDQKLIEDYLCNDDEVEGLKIHDCKVWK
ncbi:eukaryotic translation elongation factor 1 gamma, putative [Cryptosporidium muris RN66]|uniref:Eukaryotic translation elongation factor 1 gamma, putative n=1 Tax=Cryptosporidium muris (strain RN66) TaxID=441375 RepID=B6AF16_CRYMR|nr:eukaryotic translation elongation factor 1 gamma, putative [Cryptosporidium muris RN66]EEA06783.1 eukaryotic translation elongation factor 1 gamma, putative [Cryptosporidium muris RN66]|eukprot:XP_002141132.1 eukaryotic translation elongation factor 1 gamma [Cryptosporidium muris RN66]